MDELKIPAIANVLKDIPGKGIIELKSLYYKDAKARIEPTKSLKTGQLIGVPNLSEDDKKRLTFYTTPSTALWVRDGPVFDLSKFEDRLLWAMVKPSHLVAESFHLGQNTPGARFYVSNEEEEIKKDLESEEKLFKVLSYIHNDKDSELIARARLLGVDMTGEGADTAKKLLLKTVRDGAAGVSKVLDLYESSVISTTILFYKACDENIIKEKNGVFMYGTMPIGTDVDNVITYLQSPDNANIVDQIKKEINPELFGKAASKKEGSTRQRGSEK